MIRILLPLAIVASMFFGPLFAETSDGSITGASERPITGEFFLDNMVGCLVDLRLPLGEECSFDADKWQDNSMVGHALNWAALAALGAAVLGVIGLLPFVGRLTSIVTVIAGIGAIAAVGMLALSLMGTDDGLGAIRWGSYLTAGAGLLTMIAGLSGMRGE